MDPIADMVTRIRNAIRARKEVVELPSSRVKREIVRILKEEGYVSNYKVFETGKSGAGKLKILFRYTPEKEPVLTEIQRVSKSSCRMYRGWKDLDSRAGGGFSVAIVSTSKGIMTGRQAKQARIGGEILVRVW